MVDQVISDSTRIRDLTVGDLKALIKQMIDEQLKDVYEYIYEIEDQMPDPDAGKSLKKEVEAQLKARSDRPGIPAEEVYRKLGLDE